jgi:anti-anti-sigma regulatory factor
MDEFRSRICSHGSVQFKAEVDDQPSRRVIRLVGSLRGEVSAEVTRLFDESQLPVQLDLADLVWIDAAGLRELVRLKDRGADLVGASPFVALQLDSAQRTRRATRLHHRHKEDR